MHALVSVGARNFETISASSFSRWLQNQRSAGETLLTPLEFCKSDEEASRAYPTGGMPYSNIIPPQAILLTMPGVRHTSHRLSDVVLVGGEFRPINSPLRSAATRKYCDRENAFSTETEHHSFVARTRCMVEVVRNTDAWVALFCDVKDCSSEDMAETVAATIANDPETVELGKNSAINNQLRGPYLIKIVGTDK
jgi:hypothetical protein